MDAYRELSSIAAPQYKELCFNSTNQNTIKHLKPVKYGGGCGFRRSNLMETTTRNRFLYWRISGSALELHDMSFDFDLVDGGLRLVFQNASIACEPGIFETAENVIILVITTTGIYRFQFPHPDTLLKGKSLLTSNTPIPSIFVSASCSNILNTNNYYMFPNNPSVANFMCASMCHLYDDSSIFSFSYQSGDIILFKMTPRNTFCFNVSIYEVKQGGVMSRILGGLVTSVVGSAGEGNNACSDMCIFEGPTGEILVCAVTWDFRLKIWSASNCELLVNEDMFAKSCAYIERSKAVTAGSKNMVRKYVGKNEDGDIQIFLGAFLNIPSNIQFQVYLLTISDSSYSVERAITYYDDRDDLIDFSLDSEMFWALWGSKSSDYVIKFEYLTFDEILTWTKVIMSPQVEEGLTISPSVDPRQLYLDHLFDPCKFSTDSIIRALSSYTHQSGEFTKRLKSLSRKELKADVCLAVEEQIRLAAADLDFDVQESEYLELQVQQWSTLYSYCYLNEEKSRRILGIFRDVKTGLVVAVKERCISAMMPGNVLDQYFLNEVPPSLIKYKEFYPNVRIEENTRKHMKQLLKCMKFMALPPSEDLWEEKFGCAFDPLVLAKKHVRFLMISTSRDFINSICQLDSCHFNAIKIMIELLESPTDRLNYYDDEDIKQDEIEEYRMLLKMFASSKGLKVVSEVVKLSNGTRYNLARDLLVLALYLRGHSNKVTGNLILDFEDMVGQLSRLVGSFHLILWCASTTVLATDISCIEKTNRSLEILNQFKHDSDFNLLQSEENSMSLLELFLLAQGREELFNKFIHFLKPQTNWKLWMNTLLSLADLVSMCLRPDSYGYIFPATLYNCCQHLHLQHYVRIVQKFYQEDIGTLNFFLGMSLLTTNENTKAAECLKEVRHFVAGEEFLMQLVADADPIYMETDYLMKVMSLFEEFEYPSLCSNVAKYTIQLADDDDDPYMETIWSKIFKCELELGHYNDAYEALFKNPEPNRQKDCLRQFLAVLYEQKEYKTIISLNYMSRESFLENEAIVILESRARSGDVLKHNFYDLLYAFHVERKNFRCAANIMYECAVRCGQEVSGLEGLEKMVEYLTLCLNCLLLVDERSAWVIKPLFCNEVSDVSSKHDFEGVEVKQRTTKAKHNQKKVEVSDVNAIKKELMLSLALLSIHHSHGVKSKKMIPMRAVAMRAGEVILLLCHAGLYGRAFRVSKFFNLSFVPVFESLVLRCIELSCRSATLDQSLLSSLDMKHQLDWIEFNEDESCDFSKKYTTASDRAWRILQTSLENFESRPSTRGLRCCAVKMFYHNFLLPSWFKAMYQKLNPSELMMLYTEYGHLQEASDLALQYIEAVAGKGKDYFGLKDYLHAGSSAVWLPYRIIDNILSCFDNLFNPSPSLMKTHSLLKDALAKHYKLIDDSGKAILYLPNDLI